MDYLSFIGKAPDVYDRLVSFIFLTLSYRYSNKNFGLYKLPIRINIFYV